MITHGTGRTGALLLTGCQDETRLTQLDQSGVSNGELVGKEIALADDEEGVYGEEFLTMGDEKTVVFVTETPADLRPGDEVEATGTVVEQVPASLDHEGNSSRRSGGKNSLRRGAGV